MTLLSISDNFNIRQHIYNPYMNRFLRCPCRNCCEEFCLVKEFSNCMCLDIFAKECVFLYTGDYDCSIQKYKDLYEAYKKYWVNIGGIQIPHHGSKHNFNSKILDENKFYIISAGKYNKFKHPHKEVIVQLFGARVEAYCINEDENSRVYFCIFI